MPLTAEQASIAEAIDAEFQRLIKLGKTHATILGQMHDHLAGFKLLMDAGVMREAGDRYPGFYRFAKVLERTARGIQSGAIPVPGSRQGPPRQPDPMRACREMAAAMDLRMRQLAEEGVPTQAIIGRMTGHLVDLQKIWTSTTDKQLSMLCDEYPAFYHFATLMEEATAAESQKSSRSYDDLPELPAVIKEQRRRQAGARLSGSVGCCGCSRPAGLARSTRQASCAVDRRFCKVPGRPEVRWRSAEIARHHPAGA
jgi:hypothetical protein